MLRAQGPILKEERARRIDLQHLQVEQSTAAI